MRIKKNVFFFFLVTKYAAFWRKMCIFGGNINLSFGGNFPQKEMALFEKNGYVD
jgi:hypothetical protein